MSESFLKKLNTHGESQVRGEKAMSETLSKKLNTQGKWRMGKPDVFSRCWPNVKSLKVRKCIT